MKVLAVAILAVLHSTPAFAKCGPCEYREKITGACVPKGGCIVQQLNPVEQVKKALPIAEALKNGDEKEIARSVGDMILNGPNCLGCQTLAKNVSGMTDEQIQSIAGRGYIVFLGSGSIELVIIDAIANQPKSVRVDIAKSPLPQSTTPEVRTPKKYTGKPECIARLKDSIYAFWKSSPELYTTHGGSAMKWPDIDITAGDEVSLESAEVCKNLYGPDDDAEALKSAKIIFEGGNTTSSSDPNNLKGWIIGKPKN